MRLRIISIWAVLILAGLLPQLAKAQIAASNPLEWAALAEGNELINGQIDKQIKGHCFWEPGLDYPSGQPATTRLWCGLLLSVRSLRLPSVCAWQMP